MLHRENIIELKEENQEEQDYETEYNTNSKNDKGRMVTAQEKRNRRFGCFGHYGEESIQKHLAALGGEDWETASHR